MDEKKTAENKPEQNSAIKKEEKKEPTEIAADAQTKSTGEKMSATSGNKDPNTICGEICFTPKKNGGNQNAEPSAEFKSAMLNFLSNNDAFKNLANSGNFK